MFVLCINTSYTTNIIIVIIIIIRRAPPNHDSEFALSLYTCIYINICVGCKEWICAIHGQRKCCHVKGLNR